MKAQTYHPFTVGRQARKGGGGGSVPAGLVEQVAQNTADIANIPVIKKETVKVYGATYTYNDPATDPDYPGFHDNTARLQNKTPLKIIFEGFYKEVDNVEQQAWDPINFKAPGGSMIGYCNGLKCEVIESETPGVRDGINDTIPYLVIGKETYNNAYTKFMLRAEPLSFGNYTLGLSVVLDSSATGTGSTEADIEALYTWETGVYAKFTVIYY